MELAEPPFSSKSLGAHNFLTMDSPLGLVWPSCSSRIDSKGLLHHLERPSRSERLFELDAPGSRIDALPARPIKGYASYSILATW
ncbi:hypothetical protein AC579_1064 [Pseudocercospora musae]|uniref:Uncharacterized protein n=1 Tax=Pseudocercospora musae TaxID=113226 RepID=A0A139GTG2_9PEZI|nr:hypothetical protein AC579_1064 [Pseudocercospora musae]